MTDVLAEYPFFCQPNNCIDMDAIVLDWTGDYLVRGMDAQLFGGSNAFGTGVFIFGADQDGYQIIDKPEEFATDNFHSLNGLDRDGDLLAALLKPFPGDETASIYQIDPDTGDVLGSVEVDPAGNLNGLAIGAPDVVPPACPGDADGDLDVDSADLNILLGQFGEAVEPGEAGDFNADGFVDAIDLNVLLGAFGSDC